MPINEIQDAIIEEMTPIKEWFDKYEYLISLGRQLKPIDEGIRSERYQIQGCQSQVWISAEIEKDILHFSADSDSLITRGIISLLLRVLDRQPPVEVMDADLYFIREIGLSSNLSPSRANGLSLIIQQMKRYGEELSRFQS
ncbi:MAG: SufE family protein [Deltaproteobacteria bacterium]|nr:SufE family protein [Deltaproteobacteria bacterium]MBW1983912.1 SufE family protein [Deltaproteobacteria bacterium]